MEPPSSTEQLDKLVRHYSERRGQDIVLRVHFQLDKSQACKVWTILQVEELK